MLLQHVAHSASMLGENVSNQVLTAQASPYYAVTNTRFANVTLEPGTTILVTGPFELTFTASNYIVGTGQAPIRFSAATNGIPWKGIVLTNAHPASRLAVFLVEKANNTGLKIFGSTLVLQSVVVANNSGSTFGGGIYTDSPLTLESCIVTNNSVSGVAGRGGGVASQGSLLRCVRSIISNNSVYTSSANDCTSFGGGLYCSGRIELLDGTVVTDNVAGTSAGPFVTQATALGGGVWAGSEIFATNALIRGNVATSSGANHPPLSEGGGLWCAGPVLLINSEVRGNATANPGSGASRAGGVRCASLVAYSTVFFGNSTTAGYTYLSEGGGVFSAGLVTLANCLLANNFNYGGTPSQRGAAIYGGTSGSRIENCTIANNTQSRGVWLGAFFGYQGSISNSIIHGNTAAFYAGSPSGVGYSIVEDADPLFIDAVHYFLSTNSPAVDAGNPDPAFNDAGPFALGTPRADQGAYGGPGALPRLGYTAPLFIITQPSSQIVAAGFPADFSVGVIGGSGSIFYQWHFNGAPIAGATNATFTLPDVTPGHAGNYTVAITSGAEVLLSSTATLTVTEMKLYAGLTINGAVGAQYRIDYKTSLQSSNWITLTTITLPSSPYLFIDVESGGAPGRYYRFVAQ